MGNGILKILIITQDKDQFQTFETFFSNVKGISCVIKWRSSIQEGLSEIQKNLYDICALINFPVDESIIQKINNLEAELQMIAINRENDKRTDISILNPKTCERLLECQLDENMLESTIPFIIKSIYVKKELELKVDELIKSEKNLLTMANTNIDGLLILDSDGYVLFGNPAAGHLYNCSTKDLIGRHLGIPLASKKITELELLRQDGNTCIVEACFSEMEWTNQKAFLVSLHDITEQEHLLATLRKASIYDELTGLFNRREMNRLLEDEILRCNRYGYSSAVIMFDIDKFKAINDTYGHAAGDVALKWISNIVNREIRSVDKAARYGGDEFIILLPSVECENARIPAERIRSALLKKPCPLAIGDNKNILLSLTISLGLVDISPNGESLETILKSVDKALYNAKRQGGNCAVV